MLDYLNALRHESARFGELIRTTNPETPVPSCPGWTAPDLFWHLTEVQYFWASIVDELLANPESVPELARPNDAELGDLFDSHAARLVEALLRRKPTDQCWSWHDAGHSVGWVQRRQAHEALIHRVDAELTAGNQPSVDEDLAADGIDEILAAYLDASDLPEWATFAPDGSSARIAIDPDMSWSFVLGRFQGTSPNTGNNYNESALRLEVVAEPSALISGRASDLDLWLWGRGPLDPIAVTGDPGIPRFVRAAAAAGTQ